MLAAREGAMAKYTARETTNGLWIIVEEGSTDPVAGGDGFQTGMGEEEAKRLAARLNAAAAEGQDER